MFHWTYRKNNELVLSNILEDKIQLEKAQIAHRKNVDPLKEKLSDLDDQLLNLSLNTHKKTALLLEKASLQPIQASDSAIQALEAVGVTASRGKVVVVVEVEVFYTMQLVMVVVKTLLILVQLHQD